MTSDTSSIDPERTLIELLDELVMVQARADALHGWCGRAIDVAVRDAAPGEPYVPPSEPHVPGVGQNRLVQLCELSALASEHHDAVARIVPTIWHVDTAERLAVAGDRFNEMNAIVAGEPSVSDGDVAVWLADQQRIHATWLLGGLSSVSSGPMMRVLSRIEGDLAGFLVACTPVSLSETTGRRMEECGVGATARLASGSRATSAAAARN